MGIQDKAQDKVGKAKEEIGKRVDNPDLEAEGKEDQIEGRVKDGVDSVKKKFT